LKAAFARANQLFFASSIQCGIHYADVLRPASTVKLIRSVAAANAAIIIVYPENKEVSSALLEISRAIPIVTLVSDLPHSGRVAYVGLDNRSAGRVAGELMARFIGPSGGDIIVVSGLHSYIGHEEREMGFRSVLRERHPKCRVVAVLESREQKETAGELVGEVLRTRPEIAGIYNVSAGNRAIAATLRKAGRVGRTVFITHELTAERRALLKEGMLDAIIDQNPEIEVMTAVETLAHHFGRRDTPPLTNITPLDILIRESV
jgi:LacI family transcriptional regulator